MFHYYLPTDVKGTKKEVSYDEFLLFVDEIRIHTMQGFAIDNGICNYMNTTIKFIEYFNYKPIEE